VIRRIGSRGPAGVGPEGLRRVARWLGAAVLVAGLLGAGRWHPERPPFWGLVERLGVDPAECDARLAERTAASFTLPADHGAPERLAVIAGWFHLDAAAVCAANAVPAGECGRRSVAPGETVTLPLARGAAEEE